MFRERPLNYREALDSCVRSRCSQPGESTGRLHVRPVDLRWLIFVPLVFGDCQDVLHRELEDRGNSPGGAELDHMLPFA